MAHIYKMPYEIISSAVVNSFKLNYIHSTTRGIQSGFERRGSPSDVRWVADMDIGDMTEGTWNALESFYDKVMTDNGFFVMFDPAKSYPRGQPYEEICEDVFRNNKQFSNNFGLAGNGSRAVIRRNAPAGASQIIVQNLFPGKIPVFENDHIEIRHRGIPMLYKSTQDAPRTDSSGEVVINIAPSLAFGVDAGADNVNFLRCLGVFQFVNEVESTRRHWNTARQRFIARSVPEIFSFNDITMDAGI